MAKSTGPQRVTTRSPRQDRARLKVELILEAAMRLLDNSGLEGGFDRLTTNAVAETAGVSIGTLYQYFPNKDAILDALAEREMAATSARVVAALADRSDQPARERIARIVRAVTAGYGERRQVQRLVIERSLAKGGGRMSPLIAHLTTMLSSERGDGAAVPRMTRAEAFVVTNTFLGVMRAMIMRDPEAGIADADIEDALARLLLDYSVAGDKD